MIFAAVVAIDVAVDHHRFVEIEADGDEFRADGLGYLRLGGFISSARRRIANRRLRCADLLRPLQPNPANGTVAPSFGRLKFAFLARREPPERPQIWRWVRFQTV
jgi:hypothetical protein